MGAVAISAAGIAPAFAADRVDQVNPDLTAVTVFNINDFHGRIDTNFSGQLGKNFACTLVNQRNALAGDSIFLSAGDNIGATPFTSMSQQDEPTIEFLNALGLDATAVGNHEFDTGWDDLNDRIIPLADYAHLGANVYLAGTTTPALPEYYITEVEGLRVGVIGAVTADTRNLVDPGGITAIEFGDPVAAVNRVAAEIADDTDVIIAQYHEGAVAGIPGSTLEDELAKGGIFARIVNETTAGVDAIFTGHTHQTYAWDAPIPGGEGTRPIVQSNSYAALIGKVTLGVDESTMTVTEFSVANVPVAAANAECADDPAYIEAAAVVDRAVEVAEEIGSVVVGEVTADITTAFTDAGARDDRARESTLSNLVAEAWLWAMNQEGRPTADIGLMNPGGVRAELFYGEDGSITYAEAAAVNPFANTMMVADVTGEQFKILLEQQWQPAGSSRPFLKLGLSDNVRYTYDPDAPRGERITGIWFNGEPMDMSATYTVTAGSFLINGGDNFTILREATNARDTGLTDLEAWTTFLIESSPLTPSFEKNGVAVLESEFPIAATAGEEISFTVRDIDLTSLGSPDNTEFTIWLGDVEVGTATIETVVGENPDLPLWKGLSNVTFTVPEDFPGGETVITLVATESGTTVKILADITALEAPPVDDDDDDDDKPVDPGKPTKPGPVIDTDVIGTGGAAAGFMGALFALAFGVVFIGLNRRGTATH